MLREGRLGEVAFALGAGNNPHPDCDGFSSGRLPPLPCGRGQSESCFERGREWSTVGKISGLAPVYICAYNQIR